MICAGNNSAKFISLLTANIKTIETIRSVGLNGCLEIDVKREELVTLLL